MRLGRCAAALKSDAQQNQARQAEDLYRQCLALGRDAGDASALRPLPFGSGTTLRYARRCIEGTRLSRAGATPISGNGYAALAGAGRVRAQGARSATIEFVRERPLFLCSNVRSRNARMTARGRLQPVAALESKRSLEWLFTGSVIGSSRPVCDI